MVALGKNQNPAASKISAIGAISKIRKLNLGNDIWGKENLRLGAGGGAACSTTGSGFGKDSTRSAGTKPRSDSGSGSGGGGGAVSTKMPMALATSVPPARAVARIVKSEGRSAILGKCKKGKRFWGACQA